MKKVLSYSLTIFLLFVAINIFAQTERNTVLFLSGKTLQTSSYHHDKYQEQFILYKDENNFEQKLNIDNVFSIVNQKGEEQIFYKPDSLENERVSIEDMRYFVYGQHDARIEYKAPLYTVGGFVLGVVSPFVINYYAPLIPGSYSTIVGLAPQNKFVINNKSKYLNNDYYKEGYKDFVRQKRVKNSLWGGVIGIIVGISTIIITR